VRIWSRQGKDLTAQFPDATAAATQLPDGCVVDGELSPSTSTAGCRSTCCSTGW
jgi:ATP-dependent DNA ligase